MDERTRQRNAAFLLGLTTIIAGFFTWRAGQIGSTAAFEDRTAIGQTISQQERDIEVGLRAINDSLDYVHYLGDYAEASGFDERATWFEEADEPALADAARQDATNLRVAASAKAATAGVFGRQEIYKDLAEDSAEPLPFDLAKQVDALEAEVNSDIRSPALDPDEAAATADAIRVRIRGLRISTLVLLIAVGFFTVVQVNDRRWMQYSAMGIGTVILASTVLVVANTVWFA